MDGRIFPLTNLPKPGGYYLFFYFYSTSMWLIQLPGLT